MLQRIQSVFLLCAALCSSLTWAFPVAEFSNGKPEVHFMTYGIYDHEGRELADASLPVPYAILHSLLAAIFIAIIFLYRNRPRQMRVVRGAWLIALLPAALQFISSNSLTAYLNGQGEWHRYYGASLFLPIGAVLFAILAERAIRKDEALVRSADRLR